MTVVQVIVNSLTLGAIYALVAVGLVVVFKATDLINFGAGDWVLAGGYIALSLTIAGLPLWLVIVLAPLGGAILGAVIYALVWRRLLRSSPWLFVVAALAVGGLLREIVVWRFESQPHPFPGVLSRDPVELVGLLFVPQNLWVVAAALFVIGSLIAFFRYTTYGKALEAVAQNRVGAQIVGINLTKALLVTWMIAGGVSTVAAILIAPSVDVSPEMGLLVVSGFVAAALGGLDSLSGAIVGGIVVALIQTMTNVFVSSGATDILLFVLLLVVMYVRPTGLFGKHTVQRV